MTNQKYKSIEPYYSKLIAGTMLWGAWGKEMTKAKRVELIETAFKMGITSFDHADIYGNYTTEKDFGIAFAESGLSRDKVQFISKCGIAMVCENKPYKTKHYNYDSSYIIDAVHASLKQLKTDYLDLLLLHRPSPLLNPEEVAKAVDFLLDSGKILSFGVSNFTSTQIDLLANYMPIHVNQIEISLNRNEPMFNGQLNYCQRKNILPMSWSPLGILKKPESQWPSKLRYAILKLSEKYDCGYASLAVAWLLKHPSKIHPVIGTSNPQRLQEIIKAQKIDFDTEDWFFLLEAVKEKPCP
ncbi:MAG: aldo/keto reductase [Flavobacteriaceae bacterium]|nr:aldo/keto reductase [Flavobacteriaceae bacterium]